MLRFDTTIPPTDDTGLIYPPRLARALLSMLPGQPLLLAVGETSLAELLSTVFFASLQTEEGEHQPIRVVLATAAEHTQRLRRGRLTFRTPCSCTRRHLLRLARGARSDRISIAVSADGRGLSIVGLARDRFGADESALIRISALQPGQLEVWVAGERILEYAHGYVQRPPEDVLLATGPVRSKLLAFAAESGAPAGYIESIASVLRHLADHPHGGILVLSRELAPETPAHASFALQPDSHLWDLLNAMRDVSSKAGEADLDHETLRSEIQRTIGEIGDMTTLDGATILDRRLGLCGFGIVLPVRSDIAVLEVIDVAGTVRRPFSLEPYGARHRAAASYAATHPGSLVFIASVSGDIGCMLSEDSGSPVLLWRFRSRDLSSPAP
jgi:hypothetical protein